MRSQSVTSEELEERTEHANALRNIDTIMSTPAGRGFMKYLFKHLDVCEMPEFGLQGEILHDRLGFLRAGNSIYKIACEANFEVAAQLMAQIEKEKYAQKIKSDLQTG